MRDGMLIRAIVVHLPDLFIAATYFDVVDLGLCNSLAATAEPEDDLIRKAVSDLPRGILRGIVAVLLGEHLRILRILRIEEIAVADDLSTLNIEAAKGHHRSGDRC